MKKRIPFLLLLVPLLFTLGCGKQLISRPMTFPADMSLADKADYSWQKANYQESQRLYAALLTDPSLSKQLLPVAWERFALSAVKNHSWDEARTALNKWARAVPNAMGSGPWNSVKAALISKEQGASAAEHFLRSLLKDNDMPRQTRIHIARDLAQRFEKQGDLAGLLGMYAVQYELDTSNEARQALETEVVSLLQDKSLSSLEKAMDATRQRPLAEFPKNILTCTYDLKRLDKDPKLWPQIWQDLIALKDKSTWAGPFPFEQKLNALLTSQGHPRQQIAMLIPLQGPYASVGHRIAQGIGAGQWYLTSQGMELEVSIINSAAPGWEKELEELGPNCQIVGGPLRKETWESIKQHGLTKNRIFFTFMSTIDNEGSDAWRFFGSPRDQARAVIQAASAKNINKFAVLYPREPYGRAMSKYFWEEAKNQGGVISGMGSYDPSQPPTWGEDVARLLGTSVNNKNTNPNQDFKAVFLPDSLKNAKLIVPQFFFYNADNLLFLGSQLWTQGKGLDSSLDARYFDRAVYPGGWWENNPGIAMKELKHILRETGQKGPSFWTALGYDFTRFAAGLGSSLSRRTLNKTLHAQQSFSWTVAPISWDKHGVAAQDYFIFQPTEYGPRIFADQKTVTSW